MIDPKIEISFGKGLNTVRKEKNAGDQYSFLFQSFFQKLLPKENENKELLGRQVTNFSHGYHLTILGFVNQCIYLV